MALAPLVQDYYVREDESDDEDDDGMNAKSGDSHESDDEDGFPAGDGMSFDDEMELERKSRLPQPVPCSASADGTESQIKSDDGHEELFYDPEADEADEKWISDKRDEYLRTSSDPSTTLSSKLTGNRIKKTDAVLNCPSCMSLLCLDCQRHETYKTQYRAMFVQNCRTDFGQELRVPQSEDGELGTRANKRNSRSSKKKKEEKKKKNDTSDRVTESTDSHNKTYYPVKCSICTTQVAVHDQDDVYHFFNVLASHS